MKRSFFGKLLSRKKKEEKEVTAKTKEREEKEKEEEAKLAMPQSEGKIQVKEKKEDLASEYEGQLAIDVYQTDDAIVIKSTIAGVRPEDIDVTVDNDMVTIRGERKQESQVKKENYFYQECYWGAFSRSVILPCDIETDKISAELKNGVLTVRLPKVDKSQVKKISVRAVTQ
ncbi:MAG: Hsp20/alpha crystallin family protein [Patescibacteria group bacterium]